MFIEWTPSLFVKPLMYLYLQRIGDRPLHTDVHHTAWL